MTAKPDARAKASEELARMLDSDEARLRRLLWRALTRDNPAYRGAP